MASLQIIESRIPAKWERRAYIAVPCLYAGLVLSVLPVAGVQGAHNPRIAAVTGIGVMLADLCTAALLASEFRYSGRRALAYVAAAFVYSGVMALFHVLTFPDALVPGTVIGNTQTVGGLFPLWRAGTLLLVLMGLWHAGEATTQVTEDRRRPTLSLWLAGAASAASLLTLVFSSFRWESMTGHAFGAVNLALSWANVALALTGVAIIWHRRAFRDTLYLWLAMALVAWAAELTLSNLSGGRYTVGWYVSRASWLVSNCVLLILWLAHKSQDEIPGYWRLIATYGAALCVLSTSLVLKWFLLPWLGPNLPFATTFAAIAITVWLGGWRPALCIATLGYVMANILFIEPVGSFEIATISQWLALALYCLTATAIIGLGEAMRRARDRYRASEQQMQRYTEVLREADTNKRNFLAVLSHELRNPLAPLRNALAVLAARPDPKTIERLMPIMDRQLSHLSRLVDDLLDVSRIDRGKLEVKSELVAMDAVLKASIETAKPNIEARSHELVVRFPADPVYVQGDMVRLSQAVANLLNNAAKYTPVRGHIELTLSSNGAEAVVSVCDNGIGMASEEIPRAFEMFTQLDSSKDLAAGGLGLGLTLSRSIAEMHRGQLSVRSDGPGKGCIFELTLPAAAPPRDQPIAPVSPHMSSGSRRILVVDDNRDAATTLAELLRLKGYEARVAIDGIDGFKTALEFLPHVAFVDLNMPGMDGFELARKLQSNVRTRSITLVALSGMGQPADIARTRESGFVAHLIKPASTDDIERLAAGQQATVVELSAHNAPTETPR